MLFDTVIATPPVKNIESA